MRYVTRFCAAFVLAACATDNASLVARAKSQNEASHAGAERAFFARGYRPAEAPTRTLKLVGISGACEREAGAGAPVPIALGQARGTTTLASACDFVLRRSNAIVVKLADDDHETTLTRAPYGSYAIAKTGALVRYVLAPRVTERERGYLEGVSCCCNAPERLTGEEPVTVFVGPDPAREQIVVAYDIVEVTLCDPKAPQ